VIKKAVIPAAGLGTRFLPATKSMPKEMLPIIDKPIIQFVVEEAISSGIEDILIVTGKGKQAIEDYFDASPVLENFLIQNRQYELLKDIQDISALADIHYIRQKEAKGLGDAILKAQRHIESEPFAVLLGDDIVKSTVPCIKQLSTIFQKYDKTIIAVEEVPQQIVNRYGIIQGRKIEDSVYLIEDIIEKPSIVDSPSNIAAVGRYVLTPEIFDCIKTTPPGKGNELQLTDSIKTLIHNDDAFAYTFAGTRYDAGDKLGYIKAIVDFGLEKESLKDALIEYLKMKLIK
jgi:UTP--glucose-1-phosphate uridylyltransferase